MRPLIPTLLIAPVVFLIATSARSQATTKPIVSSPAGSITLPWPKPDHELGKVDIVTMADAATRHHCHVQSITPDTITCGSGLVRKKVTYRRDDVAAIIDPPNHAGEHLFFGCMTVAIAGTVAAAIFLPAWAAVVIGVPAIVLALETAMFTDGDSNNDTILYQNPNTNLTLKLRTH
jgi:hypothetical protein